MQNGLISVVMPVYNTNPVYLREAIDSILNQTYQDLELLVVDDCSPVRDVDAVIASYTDPRIRYFARPVNEGAAGARNFALDQATGEFVAFLDSDDIALPTRFAEQLAFLQANPDIGIVGSEHIVIPSKKRGTVVTDDQEIKACAMFLRCPASQSSVMLRKNIWSKSGVSYKKMLAEDYAFWLDMTLFTKSANLPKPLTLYRWHGDNTSIKKEIELFECTRIVFINKWQEVYNVKVPVEVKNFLFLKMRNINDLGVVNLFFRDMVNKISDNVYTDPDLAIKYLGKLYRKTLRKYKSGAMIRAMLKSPLATIFKLDSKFKIEMFFKSLLMKE